MFLVSMNPKKMIDFIRVQFVNCIFVMISVYEGLTISG